MSFLFHMNSDHILVIRRSHSNGAFSTILDFSIDFFAYWRSIREEVYSVIDRLHVTGFIQSIFGILVRGEINSSISPRPFILDGIPITENGLYSSMSPSNWLYSNLSHSQLVIYDSISMDNWLYSCLYPRTSGKIVVFPPDNYSISSSVRVHICTVTNITGIPLLVT